MKSGNSELATEERPATGWDKVHALALCVLAVVGIVIFVGPYVERLFVQGGGQSVPQQVVVSPWGRPPVASSGGQQVVCAMPPTFEELSKAFVCVCPSQRGQSPLRDEVSLCFKSADAAIPTL